jgi:hypothetical protein
VDLITLLLKPTENNGRIQTTGVRQNATGHENATSLQFDGFPRSQDAIVNRDGLDDKRDPLPGFSARGKPTLARWLPYRGRWNCAGPAPRRAGLERMAALRPFLAPLFRGKAECL